MARLVVAVLVLVAWTSAATAREDVRRLTCEQAHTMVIKQGAVVFTTGEGTYNRFVRTRRLCQREEIARTGKAATVDDPECLIGYICVPRIRNEN